MLRLTQTASSYISAREGGGNPKMTDAVQSKALCKERNESFMYSIH